MRAERRELYSSDGAEQWGSYANRRGRGSRVTAAEEKVGEHQDEMGGPSRKQPKTERRLKRNKNHTDLDQ